MTVSARSLRRQRQAAARKAARTATRALGCRCDVDITRNGAVRFTAAHDDDCPLTDAPSTVVFYNQDAWGCQR